MYVRYTVFENTLLYKLSKLNVCVSARSKEYAMEILPAAEGGR
jgi:hypothetical protein